MHMQYAGIAVIPSAQHRFHLTAFGAGTRRPSGRKSGFQAFSACQIRRQARQHMSIPEWRKNDLLVREVCSDRGRKLV